MNIIVDLEIGDKIWLRTRGGYHSGRAGVYYGLPENCYPDDDPEYDFSRNEVSLVIEIKGQKYLYKADSGLADLYYDDIQIAADCEYAYQQKLRRQNANIY